MVKQWLAVGEQSLTTPHAIHLPYSHYGHFQGDKPRALSLQFSAVRGQRVNFALQRKKDAGFTMFAEVFNNTSTLLLAADTANSSFAFDVSETGSYTLRLQPKMAQAGSYQLDISLSASLGFPVAGNKAYVSSVWGNDRDGGKRKHEGIDIVAAKRTPVIAIADGYISSVKEGGLGGKTVSLRPNGTQLSLYYAHLDEQLVHQGQVVYKGDTLGLVGNTGNAEHTAAHLHFGIYTYNGAIDPLPFVNKAILQANTIPKADLNANLILKKPFKPQGHEQIIGTNILLTPLAYNGKQYLVELPTGELVEMAAGLVKKA